MTGLAARPASLAVAGVNLGIPRARLECVGVQPIHGVLDA
jgi:hypothetical protein